MIIIIGQIVLKSDQREEAIRLGIAHSARSRAEPGCVAHDCYLDADNPNRMHFFEKWEDIDSVRTHFAVPESGSFMRAVAACSESPPTIEIFAAEAIDVRAG